MRLVRKEIGHASNGQGLRQEILLKVGILAFRLQGLAGKVQFTT